MSNKKDKSSVFYLKTATENQENCLLSPDSSTDDSYSGINRSKSYSSIVDTENTRGSHGFSRMKQNIKKFFGHPSKAYEVGQDASIKSKNNSIGSKGSVTKMPNLNQSPSVHESDERISGDDRSNNKANIDIINNIFFNQIEQQAENTNFGCDIETKQELYKKLAYFNDQGRNFLKNKISS